MRYLSVSALLLKLETVSGTFVEPASSDIVPIKSAILPKIEYDKLEDTIYSLKRGMHDVKFIEDWARVPLEVTIDLPASHDLIKDLLAISNLSKTDIVDDAGTPADDTDDTVTGYTYAPISDSSTTASVVIVTPRFKIKAKGAKAKVSISGKVGDRVSVKFSISSNLHEVENASGADFSVDTPATYEYIVLRKDANSATIDSTSFGMTDFEFDMGSEYTQLKSVEDSKFVLKNYKPTVKLDAYLDDSEFEAGYDSLVSGSAKALNLQFNDSSGTTKWELAATNMVENSSPELKDSDGVFAATKNYLLKHTSGDDNFTLTYTV